MFAHFAFGTQANAAGTDGREDEQISPDDTTAAALPPPTHPSIPSEAAPPAGGDDSSPAVGASIDSLAHKLSVQRLQLITTDFVQSPSLSASARPSVPVPEWMPEPQLFDLEVDDDPQSGLSFLLERHEFSGTSTEVNDADVPAMTDSRRLRRQMSTRFHNDPVNSRSIQTHLEEMISTGTQCNVHPSLPSTPITADNYPLQPIIEPDDNLSLPTVHLEVDEAYCGENAELAASEDASLIEAMMTLRRAGGPAGIRKHGLLRYRASQDAALRCGNVVRSRPRMRKRNKTRPSSLASSVVTSAVSSPALRPSIPFLA